jgi:hypothetical protein
VCASKVVFGDDGGPVADDTTRKHKKKHEFTACSSTIFQEEEGPSKKTRRAPSVVSSNIISETTSEADTPKQSSASTLTINSKGSQFGKENLDSALRPKTPSKLKKQKESGAQGPTTRMGEEHLSLSGLVPPPNPHHAPVHGVGLGLDHPLVSEMLMQSRLGEESISTERTRRNSKLLSSQIF